MRGAESLQRKHRAALVVALGFALGATFAPPSAPQADNQDAIVVTGSAPTAEEIRRQAIEFVQGTGIASGQTPAARWADPVCPQVFGLAAGQARAVEAKMRSIAETAKIRVARSPCRANIVVTFAPDAGAVVREIGRRSPRRLSEVPSTARAALLEGLAPIRWWYSTDIRSRHGSRGRATPPPWTGGGGAQGGGSMLPASVPSVQHYDSSVVSTQVHRVLVSASVVVDAERAAETSLDAIASYAAFVAFAEIRAADFTPPGSILGLFDKANAARELTDQDLAFLRALYRLSLDRASRHHRGVLVRDIVAARIGG